MRPLAQLVLAAAFAALVAVPTTAQDPSPGALPKKGSDLFALRDGRLVKWLDPQQHYERLRQAAAGVRPPEFVEYIIWNVTGEGQGWFHPGQSRYGWEWLASRHGIGRNGTIGRKAFKGPAEAFDRLDRNRDGVLTAADFDWPVGPQAELAAAAAGQPGRGGPMADRATMIKRMQEIMAGQLFGLADGNGDGKVSKEEWQALFTKAAKGKNHLTADDLREVLQQLGPRRAGGVPGSNIAWVRILGMFKSETGSIWEGPAVGQLAPNFTLKTQDGKQEVTLSSYRDRKPVVLVFGNYT